MNKYLLIVCCLLVFATFHAQKKDKSIVLYDQGNLELAKKNYKLADSLFTLSLNISPHPDTYFNRAACRRKMNNFEGYCQDIGGAASYRDKEAIGIYYKDCCTVDTIITSYENGNAQKGIKWIEFITSYKYNENNDYEKYDKDSTLLVSYNIYNSDTIYKSGTNIKLATFQEEDNLLFDFIQKTKFADWIKTNHYIGKLMLTLIIDEHGKVYDIKVIQTINNEFEKGLIKELYGLPNAVPANLIERNVKSQKTVSIIFAKDLLYSSTTDFGNKKLSKKITYLQNLSENSNNETMPEFSGGAMEMMKYIQKNIVYPQTAKEAGLSGKCFLRFIVTKEGLIKNVNIVRGVPGCIECDVESTRVIYSMPKWKAGTQKEQPVSVLFNLPINFQLK
jgi:Na+-translocating ferredoxin:NAD+ oxidoreductase RnfG subunit